MFQVASVRRYADLPIPCDEDVLVEEFIREWTGGSSAAPEATQALHRLAGGKLLTFARRAASRAVREREPNHIRLGLSALCIAGADDYPVDLPKIACVLYDSCIKVGVDPTFMFREAAGNAEGGAESVLRSFGSMPKAEVLLSKYRVRE